MENNFFEHKVALSWYYLNHISKPTTLNQILLLAGMFIYLGILFIHDRGGKNVTIAIKTAFAQSFLYCLICVSFFLNIHY